MSITQSNPTGASSASAARPPHAWLPFGDESRVRRLVKIAAWIGAIALVVAALELVEVDVRGWFSRPVGRADRSAARVSVAGWSLQALQTTLTASPGTSSCAPPSRRATVLLSRRAGGVRTGVALNGFLPANVGTLVMLLMFVAIIPGANFAGAWAARGAEDLLHGRGGVRLRVSVPVGAGLFELRLRAPHDSPVLFAVVIVGGDGL